MSPFQQLRLWLRDGPPAERSVASAAFVLVLVLICWAAIPTGSSGSDQGLAQVSAGSGSGPVSATPGTSRGGTAARGGHHHRGSGGGVLPTGSGSGGGPTTTVSRSGGGGPVASSTPTSGNHHSSAPTPVSSSSPKCPVGANTDQGITASTITIGVVVVDIGALNGLAGLQSEAQAERAYRAVFADINSHGGAACRKLVPKFYSDNVLSATSEQSACLQIQQDHDFAVINNLYNPQTLTCIPQAKIPNFWYTPPHTPTLEKYSPYIISWAPDYDRLVADYIRGAKQVGWFKGAKKIGLLETSCYPDENSDLQHELTAVGYPSKTWSVYDYGCPTSGSYSANAQTSAALQFKRAGVDHVVSSAYDATPGFAKAGGQQHYVPKYAVMSDAQTQLTDHSSNPNPGTMNDTLDITTDQVGAQDTHGYPFNAASKHCNQVMTKAGLPLPTAPGGKTSNALEGVGCVSASMLVAAIDHAPSLDRASLAQGLANAGQLDLGFPAGPAHFTASSPTGGEFWRTGAFHVTCNCWVVTNQKWRPGFTS